MSNPILNSESFERAAYSLSASMNSFNKYGSFEDAVSRFERSVNKMQQILGMQAENDQRKATGSSMAYTENDFLSV